jgi:hypothetical protein
MRVAHAFVLADQPTSRPLIQQSSNTSTSTSTSTSISAAAAAAAATDPVVQADADGDGFLSFVEFSQVISRSRFPAFIFAHPRLPPLRRVRSAVIE